MEGGLVAVVLAGGGADPLAERFGVATKAEVPFRGRPLGAWVLDALAGSRAVRATVFVGERGVHHGSGAADGPVRIPAGRRMVDSLAMGLGAAAALDPERILVVTADLPWLTGAVVDDLVERAPDADLVYPAVRREAMERRFPDQPRTYVRVGGEQVTGGNAVLLAPSLVPTLLPLIDRAYRARKSPITIARLIGLDLAFRLATGRLSLAFAERRVSELLGAPARAMTDADPSVAADVDRLQHLESTPPHPSAMVGEFE